MDNLRNAIDLLELAQQARQQQQSPLALLHGAAALLALEISHAPPAAEPRLIAPPPKKRGRKKRANKQTKAAPPAPAVNGTAAHGASLATHNGKSITVTPKCAAVFALLYRAMPHPIDKRELARRVWDRTDDLGEVLAGQTCINLGKSVDAIGLRVVNTRGIGYSLQPV